MNYGDTDLRGEAFVRSFSTVNAQLFQNTVVKDVARHPN